MVGGVLSASGSVWRLYTMSAKPRISVIATAAGNTVPPWNRTLRPFPFCASLAAFLVELGLATAGHVIGVIAPSACASVGRRRAEDGHRPDPQPMVTPRALPIAVR